MSVSSTAATRLPGFGLPYAWLQLQEPFSRLAGRTDIDAGYAQIEVELGDGVIAYASVIDNATNDGTAITMKR